MRREGSTGAAASAGPATGKAAVASGALGTGTPWSAVETPCAEPPRS